MSLLELSLSEGYVEHWTWKEGIREVIQNALDCEDFEIKFKPSASRGYKDMRIITADGAIPRTALLMGESGKRDSSKIGKFGEGLKLALLILAREGYHVEITSGKELWIPEISESEIFQGVRTLKIEILENPQGDKDLVEVAINGLPDEYVDYLRGTYLLDSDINNRLVAEYDGSYALEPEYVDSVDEDGYEIEDAKLCKVFCGGLYVCDLPEGYDYSYNIAPGRLTLDRDRKTVQTWDLQYEVVRLLTGAGKTELLVKLANKNAKDIHGYSQASVTGGVGYGSRAVKFKEEVTELAVDSFKKRYGDKAVPFTNETDQVKVKMAIRAGYTPVFVTSAEYQMIDNKISLPSGLVEVKRPDVLEELTDWVCKYGDIEGSAEIIDLVTRLEEYAVFMGLQKSEEDKNE